MSGRVNLCTAGLAGVPAGEHITFTYWVRQDVLRGQYAVGLRHDFRALPFTIANTAGGVEADSELNLLPLAVEDHIRSAHQVGVKVPFIDTFRFLEPADESVVTPLG